MSLLKRLEEQKQYEENPEALGREGTTANATSKNDPYQYLKTAGH